MQDLEELTARCRDLIDQEQEKAATDAKTNKQTFTPLDQDTYDRVVLERVRRKASGQVGYAVSEAQTIVAAIEQGRLKAAALEEQAAAAKARVKEDEAALKAATKTVDAAQKLLAEIADPNDGVAVGAAANDATIKTREN